MTQHILSLSYGKDSLACLGAIEKLGWPLDRIVHAEVWATDTIPADLPPMVEFKKKADAIIKSRFGIEVEHIYAMDKEGNKQTYEKIFYRTPTRKPGGKFEEGSQAGFPYTKGAWCNDRLKTNALDSVTHTPPPEHRIYGFPMRKGNWCNSYLKMSALRKSQGWATRWSQYCTGELKCEPTASLFLSGEGIGVQLSRPGFSNSPTPEGADTNILVQYLGIAADEPKRLARLDGINKISPLAAIGWTEADCWKWCEENDLLSPIYTTATRGGCWFCHNQRVDQLRLLRQNYPDLWELLLKWDSDSPVTFHADGHTVHDFDRRFEAEEKGIVPYDRKFRWSMLESEMYEQTRLY